MEWIAAVVDCTKLMSNQDNVLSFIGSPYFEIPKIASLEKAVIFIYESPYVRGEFASSY